VAHSLVDDIVLDGKAVNSMDCGSSVVGLVDSITPDIRSGHITNHMEMDWILSYFEGLSTVKELGITYSSLRGVITVRVKHDSSSILVWLRKIWVSLILNISGQ
jgi:hypothetical protein